MLKRTLSGAVYVALIVAFLVLRQNVDTRIFNIFTLFLCAVGTFEVARAIKQSLFNGWFLLITIYGGLFFVNYAVIEYFFYQGYGYIFSLALCGLAVLVTLVFALIKKAGFKKFIINSLGFIYPALFLLCLAVCNDIDFAKGYIGLLLIFIISPLTDTLAYLVGMSYSKIKKGNVKKLCPRLSPKKTVAGAIGGLLGGVIGGVLICAIFNAYVWFDKAYLIFITIGLISAVLTETGDLFESYIKRKVGLKDMGKIMPGHGGVMDRIDGMLFVMPIVTLFYILV